MQNRNSTQNYIEPYPNFADQLPELPALSLTGLNIRLVTHRSKLGNAAGNYELDALMGNHLIKYHCSAWMKNNYGNITPGVVTIAVDGQANKENLARISAHYGLHGLINADTAQIRQQNLRANRDVRAGLFQAYVHGLYLHDQEIAIKFIEDVFSILIKASLGY